MNTQSFLDEIEIKEQDINQIPPLALAYIGDSVFEILIRNKMIQSEKDVGQLHKKSSKLASARGQAKMYHILGEYLTKEEESVLRRGRNAKSSQKAKNATISEYRHATGVEALFGYLFLKGEHERIIELFKICIKGKNCE